jgi:GTP cyclohydrolase I
MQTHIQAILEELDPNPERAALKATPKRVADALRFLTQGHQIDPAELINSSLYPCTTSDLIVIKNIEFYSLCEHHLLPFFGKCHIAYLPSQHILGLSKFGELVDAFSRRLQIQENLCAQIANCIQSHLAPKGLAVVMEAEHLCMKMQGIQKQQSSLYTQVLKGELAHANPQQSWLFTQLGKN